MVHHLMMSLVGDEVILVPGIVLVTVTDHKNDEASLQDNQLSSSNDQSHITVTFLYT